MAKYRKRGKQQQAGLQDSDLQWLAEKYKAELEQTPDLPLNQFAIHHGVEPKWIRRFIDAPSEREARPKMSIGQLADRLGVGVRHIRQWIAAGALEAELVRGIWYVNTNPGNWSGEPDGVVNLWHGTTADRAARIQQEGFRALGLPPRAIWFTTLARFAQNMAINRGQQRKQAPTVISCGIDLRKYSAYVRPSTHVYVFYIPIGSEVIKHTETVEDNAGFKKLKKSKGASQAIDVTVTKTSGKLGVLAWLNRYLETQGKTPIDESHRAVDAILSWVETQYAAGRETPISDEEMEAQVVRHLGEVASSHIKIR